MHSDENRPASFHTTQWSAVINALANDSAVAIEAFERLCCSYWDPLYAYVRRKGYSPFDAEDLTQEFFARLIEKQWLKQVDRSKGRFRSFLLAAMNHFLANEWKRDHRKKRAGHGEHFSLDYVMAENRYRLEPVDSRTPEQLFDRRWALTALERVWQRLQREHETLPNHDSLLFSELKGVLTCENTARYSDIGERFAMSEAAVKKAVQRMRERYGVHLRSEVAETLADTSLLEQELRALAAAVQ